MPSLPTAIILLLFSSLLLTVVNSLRRLPEDKLSQNHPRQPKFEHEYEKVLVLDFSEDSDQEPDRDGEYTHATLRRDPKDSFPSSFTVCSTFMAEAWTGFSSASMFQLNDKFGNNWGYVNLYAAPTFTEYEVYLGAVYFVVGGCKGFVCAILGHIPMV